MECFPLVDWYSCMGLLKKAASGVLAIFPCSRTRGTLRAANKGAVEKSRPAGRSEYAGCGLARGNGASWGAGVGRVRKRTFLNRPEAFDIRRVPGKFGPWTSSLFNTPCTHNRGGQFGSWKG